MKNIVSTYAEKFRQDRQKQLKLAAVLAALAVIVAGIVFWQLHSTGVAMSNEVYCGMEEHVHDDSCYEHELICDSEDEDHVHDDSCYATVLVCDIPEHTHTVACLTDDTADVETASDWEETLPSLTGIWSRDVAAVAESQVGYSESMLNYTLAEDGETHQGYSRYGAWYGNEYGDWDAMFASFCLNYAGVPEEEFPEASGAYAWTADLAELGLYVENESFTPSAGDLIFFDDDLDGEADRAGVVIDTDSEEETIAVIEGNSNDAVEENLYDSSDNRIMGFGLLPAQDLDEETVYTIEYDSNEAEYLDIDGPEQVLENGDLTFFVTVDLNDGYDITEATVNGEELEPVSITASEDGQIFTYEYTVENVEENMAVFLAAKQVIDGSGSVGVYEKADSYNFGSADYTLTVSNVPTNTKISLDSPHISINLEREDMNLSGNLKYVSKDDTTEEITVEYLMLDGPEEPADENSYTVTPYADGEALNMETGILIIDTEKLVTLTVDIWPIQTNSLCTQEGEDKVYTQKLIGAKTTTAAAQNYTFVGSVGGDVDLADVAGNKTFYYGTIGNDTDDDDVSGLYPCESARIVENVVTDGEKTETVYKLLPLDAEGNVVEDYGSIFMVNDRLFSFDVNVQSIVNEHTEDNGDVYLWKGTTYYVDRYHNQGGTSNSYTNATSKTNDPADKGVWVQLAEIREPLINAGTKTFSDYSSVTITKDDRTALTKEGVTATIADAVSTSWNYGIAGPYTIADGSTAVTTTPTRVTGHIGDEFTAAEEFGTSIVYLVKSEDQFHSDWIDVGAHPSDDGTRAWWYWISDYYQLNNYEDEVEYVQIRQNGDGEVRLFLDELGAEDEDTHLHSGEEYDIWDIVGLFTKRNSVIKSDMVNNPSNYSGMSFNAHPGEPAHIQLRMNGAVETIINGEKYIGELKLAETEDSPSVKGYVTLSTTYVDADNQETNKLKIDGNVALDNTQEAKIYYFRIEDGKIDQDGDQYYVSYADAFNAWSGGEDEDPDDYDISIGIKVSYIGTLKGEYGDEITFTDSAPYVYEDTMTADELREAYSTCPNSSGYDISVNISDAVKANVEANNQITIYKIWDDDSNAYGSRNNVEYVSVNLQRSKEDPAKIEDVEWEDVRDIYGDTKEFQIRADSSSSTADAWSLVIYSDEIDLTYKNEDGETLPYYFRIKPDSENIHYDGSTGGYNYTGTYDGLTVTNALDREVITIEGVKNWLDADGNPIKPDSSTLPESVIIAVYQDDQFYEMQEVKYEDAYGAWAFEFDGLPQYRSDRTEYKYTLYELAEDGTRAGTDDQILLGNIWYKVTIGGPTQQGDSGTYVYEITNQAVKVSLPMTGGTGTWIFTAAGVCLIGGAAAALIYRKRRAVRS